MVFIAFDEWMPDRAALGTGSLRALNVLPTAEGFETSPGFSSASGIAAAPSGVLDIQAFDTSEGDIITVAMCLQHLYIYFGGTWVEITHASGPYNTLGGSGFWSYDKWGDILYLTNYVDPIQRFDLTQNSPCTDLDDSITPHCRHLRIIGDFLVAFDTNDASGSNPTPYRMHWSGRLRPEDFTPSLATQAGFRDLIDIGNIVIPMGGQFGFILGQKGSTRIDYAGPPIVWQLTRLDEDVGCLYRNSAIKVSNRIFWYSPKGWRRSDGGPSISIGSGKTDAYFRQRIDTRSVNLMSHAALRDETVIMFSYVSVDSVNGLPDEVLFYNMDAERFTEGRYSIRLLGSAGRPPLLLDDPVWGELLTDDIDDLIDTEGDDRPNIIAVGTDNLVLAFTPSIDSAYMVSKEIQFFPGKRARVLRVRLVAEGDSPDYQIQISTREHQPTRAVKNDPWLKPERTGACAADRRGRYHRFAVQLNGRYTSILGLEIDAIKAGDK